MGRDGGITRPQEQRNWFRNSEGIARIRKSRAQEYGVMLELGLYRCMRDAALLSYQMFTISRV